MSKSKAIDVTITLHSDGSGWVEEADCKVVAKDDDEVMQILALFVMQVRSEVEGTAPSSSNACPIVGRSKMEFRVWSITNDDVDYGEHGIEVTEFLNYDPEDELHVVRHGTFADFNVAIEVAERIYEATGNFTQINRGEVCVWASDEGPTAEALN